MAKKQIKNPEDYIEPLSMNGLDGRMLLLKPPKGKSREMLVVYGHHASLERMWGLAGAFNKYGGVTVPDMPGFGGMTSFYKIGKKPDIDTLADYLAAFIKLRYKKKRFTIVAISLGSAIVTRMLQKYPELVKRVDDLASVAGFVHHDDFKPSRRKIKFFKYVTAFLSTAVPAWLIKHVVLQPFFIRWFYTHFRIKALNPEGESEEDQKKRINFEVELWQKNDVRTHYYTLSQMLGLNLCNHKVDTKIYHVAIDGDQYFDNHMIEQHMCVIYKDFVKMPLDVHVHAPTVIATAEEAAVFIPRKLKILLNKRQHLTDK